MKRGSVLVDVAIDQGGCFETTRPTTHAEPTYVVDDMVHYCVANMPGAVRSSTSALTNVRCRTSRRSPPRVRKQAVADDPALAKGVNVAAGAITCEPVAEAVGLPYTPLDQAVAI